MRTQTLLVLAALVVSVPAAIVNADTWEIQKRGDADNDDDVDLYDGLRISAWYYQGGPAPECFAQADANDDGMVTSGDTVLILNWYFSGGPPPVAPGPFATSCSTVESGLSCDNPFCEQ